VLNCRDQYGGIASARAAFARDTGSRELSDLEGSALITRPGGIEKFFEPIGIANAGLRLLAEERLRSPNRRTHTPSIPALKVDRP
jgi:hypothetical protein